MNYREYEDRVLEILFALGAFSVPTQQEVVDAWNNQVPARKFAESFKIRKGKKRD